ncbi:MAG: hypothetical protein R3D83_09200 [Caenibius sp.]
MFEDRDSEGFGNKISSTADTVLNGTIYLPNSGLSLQGTAYGHQPVSDAGGAYHYHYRHDQYDHFLPAGQITGQRPGVTLGARVRLVS